LRFLIPAKGNERMTVVFDYPQSFQSALLLSQILLNFFLGSHYAFFPAMFTIHVTPNLSVNMPNVLPHGAFSSGCSIVPPAESFLWVQFGLHGCSPLGWTLFC
jgi:hypothetical protein